MHTLLDVQSSFSLLWGTADPVDLLRRAGALGYRHVAITDHANLYALPRIVRESEDLPCRPLFGAAFPHGPAKTVALVEHEAGYANLCRIITRWHAHADDPRTLGDPDLCACTAGRTAGLVFLSDDKDVLTHLVAQGAACFFRVGRTLARPPAWAARLGLACAFAPEVCMALPEEHATHRLLRAIALGKTLPQVTPPEAAPPAAFLRAPADYADRFAVFGEAMRTTERIARRLAFTPTPRTIFPPSPHPDRPAVRELRDKAYRGARERYGGVPPRVADRLEYELGLIEQKGFARYFLVVEDIVRASPRTCGRGSGAASLVNYCLGVTNVDPIKYDLMFERFLNPGRQDPPDIDVDFAWDERDDVLDYTLDKYGARQAALVCNHLTFQPRMAIRETARAHGLADEEITQALRTRLPEFRETFGPVAVKHRGRCAPRTRERVHASGPWRQILAQASRLVGLPRMLTLHCGGMVIVPDELAAHVPVETSAKGYPMIQWEKDGTEDMGLVKIDLLGNRSLAVIRDAVRSVVRTEGKPRDRVLPQHPAEDEATRRLMARGATLGVFYVESPAMRLLQQKARRGDFAHLVIHSSIIRPAANRYINEYLARLHGKPWQPLHPLLAGVLDETYGVPVYQEDVCKLAMALAGFDATQADRLRKCLGKRDAAKRLAAHRGAFSEGGRARGVPKHALDAAWDAILSMTGYSFCKPHSASYAQVSFEAAYLKAHYPAHFMAAVLSNGAGYYSAQAYVSECMRLGLRVHGPCVNRSDWTWTEDHGGVRVGFMAVKGLHRKAVDAILHERTQGGAYRSLEDLWRRARLPAEDLHRLAMIGALDALAPALNRPQILWMTRLMTGRPARLARRDAQQTLFGAHAPRPRPTRRAPPRLCPLTGRQLMETEYAYLDALVGAHPLALYEDRLRSLQRPITSSRTLAQRVGEQVTLVGWPVTGKVVSTKLHEMMEFFSFEDHAGLYETVLFPQAYRRYAREVHTAQPLLVTGTVHQEFDACTVHVTRVKRLVAAGRPAADRLLCPT